MDQEWHYLLDLGKPWLGLGGQERTKRDWLHNGLAGHCRDTRLWPGPFPGPRWGEDAHIQLAFFVYFCIFFSAIFCSLLLCCWRSKSTFCCTPFAIAICHLPFTIYHLPFTICHLLLFFFVDVTKQWGNAPQSKKHKEMGNKPKRTQSPDPN